MKFRRRDQRSCTLSVTAPCWAVSSDSGLTTYSSNQIGFMETVVAFPGHNNVIQNGKPEYLPCFRQLAVHAHVGFAGIRIPGGMVMHKDNGSSPVGNGVCEELARMNRTVVKQADGDNSPFDPNLRPKSRHSDARNVVRVIFRAGPHPLAKLW